MQPRISVGQVRLHQPMAWKHNGDRRSIVSREGLRRSRAESHNIILQHLQAQVKQNNSLRMSLNMQLCFLYHANTFGNTHTPKT
jgi:hypothetical protein